MGLYAAGQVVFLTFPFSDLSRVKLRPVLLIADASQLDWIACQITSNPYIDILAVPIELGDFAEGGLRHISFVRPGKIFTANESLMTAPVGTVLPEVLDRVIEAMVAVVRGTQS